MPSSRRLVLAGTAVVLVGVGALGASTAFAGDEVPAGVRVAGVDVGGLTRADAERRLAEGLGDRAVAPVAVTADGTALTLDPRAAGLAVDHAASVREAASAGPVDRLRAAFGAERDVEPVLAVDEPALRTALDALADRVDREAREGAVTFAIDPQPSAVPVLPVTGRALDVDGAVSAVREGWLVEQRLALPVELDEVETTEQDVQDAVERIARPAIAAPIALQIGGDELVVEPADLARSLRIEVDDDGELVPRLLPDVLHEQVRERLSQVGQAPVDATFDVSSGTPVVVPARAGRSVSAADLAAAVSGVLTAEPPRRATAPLTPAAPRISTERAKALGVREVIGTYTSGHPCCRPRVKNIQRIADIVDGHVLLPGEEFDLNAFVGPRDRARGFVEAPQILDGEFVDRVGGGVSQFATALWNAVFFSGLEDITHTPHSYWIRRYPPGREATVSYPKPDLIFRNDSPHGVLIDTSYTRRSVTVTFWGTRRFDEVRSVTGPKTRLRGFETQYVQRSDCTATEGEQGFDITVTRVFVRGGQVVEREPFRTRYKPEPRFICGPPPTRAPATRAPATRAPAVPTPQPTASSAG